MKKKLLTSILLSTMVLAQGASLVNVHADSTDDKIAAQDSKINSLNDQQKSAQAQVDQIQAQVSSIQSQQEKLKAENEKLQAESTKLSAEIETLSKNIVARNESLANQARSAQTSGTATSYINTIVNSKSIPDLSLKQLNTNTSSLSSHFNSTNSSFIYTLLTKLKLTIR